MRKTILVSTLAMLCACGNSTSGSGSTTTTTGGTGTTAGGTTGGGTGTTTGGVATSAAVSLANLAFSPSAVTVARSASGSATVVFTNNDSFAHEVVADSGQSINFDSQSLNQGQSYSAVITQAGTFKVHCAIHTTMTMSITVQ